MSPRSPPSPLDLPWISPIHAISQVSLTGLKQLLLDKLEACVRLLLDLVRDRARDKCKLIQEGFAAMHEQLQDSPSP